jgi:hypothetical protein
MLTPISNFSSLCFSHSRLQVTCVAQSIYVLINFIWALDVDPFPVIIEDAKIVQNAARGDNQLNQIRPPHCNISEFSESPPKKTKCLSDDPTSFGETLVEPLFGSTTLVCLLEGSQ